MDEKKQFGEFIRLLRKVHGLNLVDLGQIVGMSVADCSAVERGELPPFNDEQIKKILQSLNRPESFDEAVHLKSIYNDAVKRESQCREAEFKRQYVATFLATWTAMRYEEYCTNGRHDELADPPAEEAVYLAGQAWESLQKLNLKEKA